MEIAQEEVGFGGCCVNSLEDILSLRSLWKMTSGCVYEYETLKIAGLAHGW